MATIDADNFITDNFLLNSETAQILYHDYAVKMPIIDYHNHLSPKQIAENKPMTNISDAWLNGDHYKWRAMRANGIDEQFITGSATQEEKFNNWASTVPYTLRNPLFHWTHLELKRYFDIDDILQESNASEIYEKANAILADKTPAQLLMQMNVEVICTTDDPIDNLQYHQEIAKQNFFTKVYPTFRPDQLFLINKESFNSYIEKLIVISTIRINNLNDLLKAIQSRVDYFDDNGCRLSDFGLEQIYAYNFTYEEADVILKKRLSGATLSENETNIYKSCIQYHLSKMYRAKNWVQQFHLGALRDNNTRLLEQLGADSGCDSMGDNTHAKSMSAFFGRLDYENSLAKTITYNLNPSQNEVFATMMGNYNSGEYIGKMQWGSGWWFLDQKDGMEKQLNALSNMGLLSRFVGMLTDSRSFLSFPRHEYFRRILCDLIAEDVNKGLIPNDLNFLGKMIQDICYNNAVNYFNFK
ncbi:glucuronate isomerase [Cellulophaga baltica]|uniref:glucuronate isomerase n=1 Tax=Cellulophaga TaxID=104264 RepID=UPI001C075450|nr:MULTISPECIES: glucuronate isomerase [Cellulophaga]MBU2996674.1 glucuronate isomerase [Cellulophaga baltica]MDO6768068.1 glucuronate isomerase [Cellulophaga sp. 1_MG-2023]